MKKFKYEARILTMLDGKTQTLSMTIKNDSDYQRFMETLERDDYILTTTKDKIFIDNIIMVGVREVCLH